MRNIQERELAEAKMVLKEGSNAKVLIAGCLV